MINCFEEKMEEDQPLPVKTVIAVFFLTENLPVLETATKRLTGP